jgi:hypothetical protein
MQFSPSVVPPKSYMSQTDGATVGGARGDGTGAKVMRPGCKVCLKEGATVGAARLHKHLKGA